jgi:hypothetical protein
LFMGSGHFVWWANFGPFSHFPSPNLNQKSALFHPPTPFRRSCPPLLRRPTLSHPHRRALFIPRCHALSTPPCASPSSTIASTPLIHRCVHARRSYNCAGAALSHKMVPLKFFVLLPLIATCSLLGLHFLVLLPVSSIFSLVFFILHFNFSSQVIRSTILALTCCHFI